MNNDSYDARLADLLTRIQNPTASTNLFLDFLNSIAKRTRFMSPFNSMLIEFQRPGANHAMTVSQWEKYGRRPLPLDSSMLILKPFSPCVSVFEFSETEPIPGLEDSSFDLTPSFELVKTVEDPQPFVDKLLTHACTVGIDVLPSSFGGLLAGDAQRMNRGIRVVERGTNDHIFALRFLVRFNGKHSPAVQVQSIVHEFAHVLLGHLGPIDSDTPEREWTPETRERSQLSKEVRELEAEAVAHLVCMSFGVDGNSAEYLRNHVGAALDGGDEWPADMSIEKVMQTARSISELLGDYIDIPVRKSIRTVRKHEDQYITPIPAEGIAPVYPLPSAPTADVGTQGQLFRAAT